MIFIGTLGLAVILVIVALRIEPRGRRPRVDFAIAASPLLLTILVPLPFAMTTAAAGPGLIRGFILSVSYVGIALSFVLFTVGIVMTVRAARSGDHRAAATLTLQTALAGLPAGIIGFYAALTWFL